MRERCDVLMTTEGMPLSSIKNLETFSRWTSAELLLPVVKREFPSCQRVYFLLI